MAGLGRVWVPIRPVWQSCKLFYCNGLPFYCRRTDALTCSGGSVRLHEALALNRTEC
jgi:hypothetical protein